MQPLFLLVITQKFAKFLKEKLNKVYVRNFWKKS